MVLAAAACLCLSVAGAAACTLAAFFLSQDSHDHHVPAPYPAQEGLLHTPPSRSSASSALTPPPPSPEAEGDWEVPRDVQQRLFRLRRRVQRAELQKEQKRQEQQRRREVQQRQQPRLWRRLVVMTATGANASGPTPPPPPPARGMGLAAVLMLSRARARSGGGVHDAGGQQYPQQQPQSTMGVQMQQQPRQRRQPYLPHIHNHYTLASSAARPAPTNTTATGGGGGGGGGGSGSSGRNNKASSLALLLAHAGRDAPPRSGKSGGGLVASTTGMSPLTVCVFASRRAAVASMLAGPQAAEFLASVDASGRSAVWWACRWGEVGILRRLLRAGGDERLPDHRGLTPRDAARMAPYPRLCLELLKQAERVNLLHKARVLLETEKMMVAAAIAQPPDDEVPPSLPSLPCVSLRPVPPPASCWWIPGGKGSSRSGAAAAAAASSSSSKAKTKGKPKQRATMGPVPRDVRAGVLEMVVGEGLSDDLFTELRALML